MGSHNIRESHKLEETLDRVETELVIAIMCGLNYLILLNQMCYAVAL